MLCRALLAAVVLSYVLCVLLLSGVQKEDIDANTLRKLQRHNVNIDDINEQQLRKQCLGNTNIPVTMLTQDNPETEKAITKKSATAKEVSIGKNKVGAGDRTKLQKIFEFLEYNRKLASKSKDQREEERREHTSTLKPEPNSKLKSSFNVEDTSSETSELRGTSVADKDDEKANKATMNKKLENLMNIWQTDIYSITTTRYESTTVKVIKDGAKNTKDVEYITKIVQEIMSKKQKTDLKTVTPDSVHTYYNSNATFGDAYQTSGAKSRNKTTAINYILNNCKLGNFYASNQDNKDKYETFDNDDGYIICKKFDAKENKVLTDRIQDNVVNNILNILKQESQRFKPSYNESAIRTPLEYQPKNADFTLQNNDGKTSNTNKKDFSVPDNEIIIALKNQSESTISNRQGDRMKSRDPYKNGFDLMDVDTARALEAALETQSNIYNQIFSRQRDLDQMSNADKERIKLLENERLKQLQSALMARPPTFSYKPLKQDVENKKYNMWPYAYLNTLNNQKQTTEPRKNNAISNIVGYINKEKSTNTPKNMEYDPKLGNQYKRPWFFSEVNEQLRTKDKEKLKGVFFKPNDENIIHSESISKNIIMKKWSPYFDTLDKKSSIIETPKGQKSIPVDSYGVIQLNNREISHELTDNSKQHSNFVGLYQNKNEPPKIIKEQSDEQFEIKKDKKISQSLCQTIHETRIECQPDAQYKSNWAYFGNKQIQKQKTNMEKHREDSEYFNYQFPSRPRITKNRYENYIAEEDLVNRNETKDSSKFPAFPQNVIKDIAYSIKEIVLKDLITTTIILPTTTTPSTTTLLPITTTVTTTTPKTAITTSTMTTTTTKSTEGTSTAETKQPFKIQDASKALEKIMEMFEKISSIKDKMVKHENVTKKEATTQTILNRQEQQKTENSLAYDPQSLQTNLENQTPHVPQPFQSNTENRVPYQQQPLKYIPQAVQMRPDNGTPYVLPAMQLRGVNRSPYVPQSLQGNPETRTPYIPPAVQLTAGNYLPYDTQPLLSNSENRSPYYPQALQLQSNKAENRIPYVQQAIQMKTENRTPFVPQPAQLKAEKENPQNLQSKLENLKPYFPGPAQMRVENRIPYFPQAVQLKAENRVPYDSQPLQRSPENRVLYDQQPLPNNLGNRVPYDPQPIQSNLDNSVPYLQQPLQYAPNNLQMKTDNRVPYDTPLQRGPMLYGTKNPYYNSKLELDPYQEKEVLEPIKQKPKPRKYAITVQTNSGEIAPLKITLHKPVLQTIVLTTKSPKKVEKHSDEISNDRKRKSISTRHYVDKPEASEVRNNRENDPYFSRHVERNAYDNHPKPRKIINEREVNQQHKPRDHQVIERFHEKLERGDAWSQYEEEKIAKRIQRPIVKNTNYDDTHFRNFLQTQQKVNAMLERILATSKNKPIGTEVI